MNNAKIEGIKYAALLLLLFTPFKVTTATSLQPVTIEPTESFFVEQLTAENRPLLDVCCDPVRNTLDLKVNSPAKVTLETLFSSQDGSWMFQSLVNNGLFKIASKYQPYHPKAIVIRGGDITLKQLHEQIKNPLIFNKTENGYRVSYPLIVHKKARLFITGSLAMNASSGAAIINLGSLIIEEGTVEATNITPNKYRPFLLSWNDSETLINNSSLKNLGYNAYLSKGITLVSSSKNGLAGRIEVNDSSLMNMEVALTLLGGSGLVTENNFENNNLYAIDARNSNISISNNVIVNTAEGAGIHLQDNNLQRLVKNKVSGSGKSGIHLSGASQSSFIIGNQVYENGENGIFIDSLNPNHTGYIELTGNILANNNLSGFRSTSGVFSILTKNLFSGNKRYGASFDVDVKNQVQLVIANNHFKVNGQAGLDITGVNETYLSDNLIYMDSLTNDLYSGDLRSIQTAIFKSSIGSRYIKIKKDAI